MKTILQTAVGILLPFAGTSIGAAAVFILKKQMKKRPEKVLLGFAAGVMTAASVWSLILPAVELSAQLDRLAFLPAAIGFAAGAGLMILFDLLLPAVERLASKKELNCPTRIVLLILAVTLHNLPEGMAVGVVFAGLTRGNVISFADAMALSAGIALQNLPEGAIISMPLASKGEKQFKAFLYGVLSGVVEPVGAIVTLLLTAFISAALPYLLSFAAGAMICVAVKELIPESQKGDCKRSATVGTLTGFLLMMILDVALG